MKTNMICLYQIYQASFSKDQKIKQKAVKNPESVTLQDLKFYLMAPSSFGDAVKASLYTSGAFEKPISSLGKEGRFNGLFQDRQSDKQELLKNGSTQEGVNYWGI